MPRPSGALTGFTLQGYSGSFGEIDAAGVGSGWSWTNDIIDASNGGIYFNTDGLATPSATTISDDQFVQATAAPETASGDEGEAVVFAGNTANGVSVTNDDFSDLSGPGAAIDTTGTGTCDGLGSGSSTGLSVGHDSFEDNGPSGSDESFLALVCTTDAQVTNNTVTISNPGLDSPDPAETPVVLGGGDISATVSGNVLTGDGASTASGIALSTASYPTDSASISGNTVTDFGQDAILVDAGGTNAGPTGFSISDNDVTASATGIGVEHQTGEADPSGTLTDNNASGSSSEDCVDATSGSGTAGTNDTWTGDLALRAPPPESVCRPRRPWDRTRSPRPSPWARPPPTPWP